MMFFGVSLIIVRNRMHKIYDGKQKVLKALETFETFFINGADLDSYCIKGTL